MSSVATPLGLLIVIMAAFFINAPTLDQVTTIQEQTMFLSKMVTIYFGNILIWIGVLAPKDN